MVSKRVYEVLLYLILLSSCAETHRGNIVVGSYFDNPDPSSNFIISVFNKNDCLMCYGAIDARFFSIVDSFQIPLQNRLAYFPDTRRKEVPVFFKSALSFVKPSDFSKVICLDKLLEKNLQKAGNISVRGSSYYLVFSPEGTLLKKGIYKSDL